MTITIGVLALQGDVREHRAALESAGARTVGVRRPEELAQVDGLVLPGGESTTIDKLLRIFELDAPLRARIADGLPVYGSCAGMILLADRLLGGTADQRTLGGLDVTVRRNAFGRQVDSFETDLALAGLGDHAVPVHAVFIRAPWVEDVGPGVEVLARIPDDGTPGIPDAAAGRIVAVQQGPLLATSFHPEISGDARVHERFVQIAKG
ncbi:pyridoxal 5'-phosphate synthase glutaminase subunit PdxT [Cellulosimicrobium marinum]|uniref:pyridoxal 5'-phosphate synthase glutaminase subunit PdxT n=1 Tax=Cellulosimicrobium marinum TaxID=1638992 RepID=UPI001E3356FD|nr:pyridoxal 5'-phosphate synthase glutaminase subunit PdxT [Cellulosimicrobium marinum]MCB7137618.1 pyridoxal 5'-phosphate synthase glutaminase subunit PdxT [Cellulosimicrobium marinum]